MTSNEKKEIFYKKLHLSDKKVVYLKSVLPTILSVSIVFTVINLVSTLFNFSASASSEYSFYLFIYMISNCAWLFYLHTAKKELYNLSLQGYSLLIYEPLVMSLVNIVPSLASLLVPSFEYQYYAIIVEIISYLIAGIVIFLPQYVYLKKRKTLFGDCTTFPNVERIIHYENGFVTEEYVPANETSAEKAKLIEELSNWEECISNLTLSLNRAKADLGDMTKEDISCLCNQGKISPEEADEAIKSIEALQSIISNTPTMIANTKIQRDNVLQKLNSLQ